MRAPPCCCWAGKGAYVTISALFEEALCSVISIPHARPALPSPMWYRQDLFRRVPVRLTDRKPRLRGATRFERQAARSLCKGNTEQRAINYRGSSPPEPHWPQAFGALGPPVMNSFFGPASFVHA